MGWVLLAALPGLLALTWAFGVGTLLNLLWCALFCAGTEAGMLRLRGRAFRPTLADRSALVTAVLLAAALPPASPLWLIFVAAASAMIFGKHLYGGLGFNPFNPAMVGYVVPLLAFPIEMTSWAAPHGAGSGTLGLLDALQRSLGLAQVATLDGTTMATPLDLVRQNDGLLMADLWARNAQFGQWGGRGWEWVNLGFLAGGLLLLQRRLISWHAPVAMLGALVLLAAFFYDNGSSASGGSPLFHLLSGGTMLGAFFIVTDPVSGATSTRGRLVFGAGVGVLVYIIRHWGNYPDAIAFAVLLMNFAAPCLDRVTQPRVVGHPRARDKTPDEAS
jgi:electron transport complex protein RnfD